MRLQHIIIVLLLLLFTGTVTGQDSCSYCGEPYEILTPDTVFVHDTTFIYLSDLNSITQELGMSFDEYVRTFIQFKDLKDTLELFPSEKIYLNYFLPLLNTGQELFKHRIITKEFIVKSAETGVELQLKKHPYDSIVNNSELQTDCMISIYGEENTRTFLRSPSQIKSCLGQLFAYIYNAKGKIKGLNFYFPDYSFREKRAMAQLIKSISIVLDSSRIQTIRDLRFYVSFNENRVKKNQAFLCGISQMTDSIFILKYKTETNTLPEISVIDKSEAQDLNFFYKLKNQLYLARVFLGDFPQTSSTKFKVNDIYNLLDADYTDNNWEIYLYIALGTLLIIFILVILYIFNPTISYFVNKNMDYIYSLLIMIFLEILILVANMFESMSKDNVFSLHNDNRYIVLLLPLLFIFIIPMMKAIGKKRQAP